MCLQKIFPQNKKGMNNLHKKWAGIEKGTTAQHKQSNFNQPVYAYYEFVHHSEKPNDRSK